ncbi:MULTISPECIES: hypothetical protein [Subtercola]|uniref:Uncharacterized protein n=1 Tax=Subtercola vilae TaxID=2056433 RepID=A0A4T2C937_9MICO|nr:MULTISPECIES: hypothetical protein [Subtercola]MEA9987240.1 hypothetical protein [Subtercola sp. RTI3]TIH40459.1 hypothetical protein D4765_02630 [Subtercola vilae]
MAATGSVSAETVRRSTPGRGPAFRDRRDRGGGANLVIGVGLGIALVSGLLEVQRSATGEDFAGLTGVFYAVVYVGFLVSTLIADLALPRRSGRG